MVHYCYGDSEIECMWGVGKGEVVCHEDIVGFMLLCDFNEIC